MQHGGENTRRISPQVKANLNCTMRRSQVGQINLANSNGASLNSGILFRRRPGRNFQQRRIDITSISRMPVRGVSMRKERCLTGFLCAENSLSSPDAHCPQTERPRRYSPLHIGPLGNGRGRYFSNINVFYSRSKVFDLIVPQVGASQSPMRNFPVTMSRRTLSMKVSPIFGRYT